jgi:hypothetical protein
MHRRADGGKAPPSVGVTPPDERFDIFDSSRSENHGGAACESIVKQHQNQSTQLFVHSIVLPFIHPASLKRFLLTWQHGSDENIGRALFNRWQLTQLIASQRAVDCAAGGDGHTACRFQRAVVRVFLLVSCHAPWCARTNA